MANRLSKLMTDHRLLFVLGSGGVGKTSSALVMALLAARWGQRVALVSIDPAKRLADAMGLDLVGKVSQVDLAHFGIPRGRGSLHASMLDGKAVFDEMVLRFAPNAKVSTKIMQHRFYQAASENLAGAGEYMALGKVSDLVRSQAFDLVIVDTPPDVHALDFLARPDLLANFFDSSVTRWMLKPFVFAQKVGLGFALSKGEKLMGGIAKVTGLAALSMMAEFLILMQDVLSGFNDAGKQLKEMIHGPECAFALVSTSEQAPLRTLDTILGEMKVLGLPLQLILINRILTQELESACKDAANDPKWGALDAVKTLARRMDDQKKAIANLQKVVTQDHPSAFLILCSEAEIGEDEHAVIMHMQRALSQTEGV